MREVPQMSDDSIFAGGSNSTGTNTFEQTEYNNENVSNKSQNGL